jgi:hypothetical protein
MKNNLIPPFILCEAGMKVMDTPKIHMDDPQVDDHSLYLDSESLRIPLSLWGIFFCFLTSKPELEEIDNI